MDRSATFELVIASPGVKFEQMLARRAINTRSTRGHKVSVCQTVKPGTSPIWPQSCVTKLLWLQRSTLFIKDMRNVKHFQSYSWFWTLLLCKKYLRTNLRTPLIIFCILLMWVLHIFYTKQSVTNRILPCHTNITKPKQTKTNQNKTKRTIPSQTMPNRAYNYLRLHSPTLYHTTLL